MILAPLVSVVMPVYNGARYLDRAVASVRAQTSADWELLAADDGSTDDSLLLLRAHAAADPRVRALPPGGNFGPSAARNHALRHARAPVVAYLDCDDEYHPDHLARVAAWQPRADVLVFGYEVVTPDPAAPGGAAVYTWRPAESYPEMRRRNIVTPLGVTHARELLDRVGGFDEAVVHQQDWDLWRRFAAAGAAFLFVPFVSGRYHYRSDSHARLKRRPTDYGRPLDRPSRVGPGVARMPP